MDAPSQRQVSELLIAWGRGNEEALQQLIPLVYDELHRLAGRYMRREGHGHTLQTSALVNETYLKLIDQRRVQWQNRAHFFGVAAQLMRRILTDYARTKTRVKRGGQQKKLSLDEVALVSTNKVAEFIALDDALTRLEEVDPQKSRIVEMKVFCGLNTEEIAEVIKVSPSTIEREWRKAKAWLHHTIQN